MSLPFVALIDHWHIAQGKRLDFTYSASHPSGDHINAQI